MLYNVFMMNGNEHIDMYTNQQSNNNNKNIHRRETANLHKLAKFN